MSQLETPPSSNPNHDEWLANEAIAQEAAAQADALRAERAAASAAYDDARRQEGLDQTTADEQMVADARRDRDAALFESGYTGFYGAHRGDYLENAGDSDSFDINELEARERAEASLDQAATQAARNTVARDHLWQQTYADKMRELGILDTEFDGDPENSLFYNEAVSAADAALAAFDQAHMPRKDKIVDMSAFGAGTRRAHEEATNPAAPQRAPGEGPRPRPRRTGDAAPAFTPPAGPTPFPTTPISRANANTYDGRTDDTPGRNGIPIGLNHEVQVPTDREFTAALEKYAAAKQSLRAEAGNDEEAKANALVDAQDELDTLLEAYAGTAGEKMALKGACLERVAQLQLKHAKVPTLTQRALASVAKVPILKWIAQNPKKAAAVAGGLVVVGASLAFTAGASLPAVLAALAAGGAKGAVTGAVGGTAAGNANAKGARTRANTRDAIAEYNELQLGRLNGILGDADFDGSYEDFSNKANNLIYDESVGTYQQNTRDRSEARRRGGKRGAIGGALGGMVMAGGHLAVIDHGAHHASTAGNTGGGDTSGSGTQVDTSHWGDASQHAAGMHKGNTLFKDVQHNYFGNKQPLSVDHTNSQIFDGFTKAHNAGATIHSHNVHLNADGHYEPVDPNKIYYFGNKNGMIMPKGGIDIIQPNGHVDSFTGSLNNSQQALFLHDAALPGAHVLNHSQVAHYLAEHHLTGGGETTPTTASHAAKLTGTHEGVIADPYPYATGAAAGVVAANRAPETPIRNQAPRRAPETVTNPDVDLANELAVNFESDLQGYHDLLDQIDAEVNPYATGTDEANGWDDDRKERQAEIFADAVRDFASLDGANVDRLNAAEQQYLIEQIMNQTNLEEDEIRQNLGL